MPVVWENALKKRDDPKLWKALAAFDEVCLWGALQGKFNLRDDARVREAHAALDINTIKKLTTKRLKEVGKPRFKKVSEKKRGLAAIDVKGSMAEAGYLYNIKVWGKPKRKFKHEPEKKKKKKPQKPQVFNKPLSVSDPTLPQNMAYARARKKAKPGETLLYIVHNDGPSYTAVYYNNRAKKRRKLSMTINYDPPRHPMVIQMEQYAKRVAAYYAEKERKRKLAEKKRKREERAARAKSNKKKIVIKKQMRRA